MQNIDLIIPLLSGQTLFMIICLSVTICYKCIYSHNRTLIKRDIVL